MADKFYVHIYLMFSLFMLYNISWKPIFYESNGTKMI